MIELVATESYSVHETAIINQGDKIGAGATIGANAVILCGNTIGCYAMLGAGTVITKDVTNHALMVGNPGRRIGWKCECGIRLVSEKGNVRCAACGLTYEISGSVCRPLQ